MIGNPCLYKNIGSDGLIAIETKIMLSPEEKLAYTFKRDNKTNNDDKTFK